MSKWVHVSVNDVLTGKSVHCKAGAVSAVKTVYLHCISWWREGGRAAEWSFFAVVGAARRGRRVSRASRAGCSGAEAG